MSTVWKAAVQGQFLAAIDMLENAIRACPDPLWFDESVPVSQRFWYLASHTIFWLDYYTSPDERGFRPRPPFGLEELDPAGVYPSRAFTRAEMLDGLEHGRAKLRARLDALDDAAAAAPCGFERRDLSALEFMLYQMRHVQHHAAQLNLLLRQRIDSAPRWVSRGRER